MRTPPVYGSRADDPVRGAVGRKCTHANGPASLRGRIVCWWGRLIRPVRLGRHDGAARCAFPQAGLSASMAARAAALSVNHCASIAV